MELVRLRGTSPALWLSLHSRELAEFLSHKQKFFAGMSHHKGIAGLQVGKFIGADSRAFCCSMEHFRWTTSSWDSTRIKFSLQA